MGFMNLCLSFACPILASPVPTVTWLPMGATLGNLSSPSPTPTAIPAAAIDLEMDRYNEGYKIKVYEDFGWLRSNSILKWAIVYSGGYTVGAFPDWLVRA